MLLQEMETAVLEPITADASHASHPAPGSPVTVCRRVPTGARPRPSSEAALALDIALDRMIDEVLAGAVPAGGRARSGRQGEASS